MKAISFVLLAVLFFAGPASSDQSVYHSFAFSQPPAYIAQDDRTIEARIFSGETVYGEVMVVDCEETNEYGAGFRIAFVDANLENNFVVGFNCYRESSSLEAGYRKTLAGQSPVNDPDEFLRQRYIGEKGDKISLQLSVSGSVATAHFGAFRFEQDLGFEIAEVYYYGFGSTGVAIFYEADEFIG